MDPTVFLPAEAAEWLRRYGLFAAELAFAALILALLFRPFWLWWSGRSEELDRLKRLEDLARKSLLELEILNKTLTIPLKKQAKKTEAAPAAEEPMVVTQATKEGLLAALSAARKAPE